MKVPVIASWGLCVAIASAQCPNDNIRFAAPDPASLTIFLADSCPDNPTVTQGENLTIKVGAQSIFAKAMKVEKLPGLGTQITATIGNALLDDKDGLHALQVETTATLIVNGKPMELTVIPQKYGLNYSKHVWSLGPATTGQPSGSTSNDQKSGSTQASSPPTSFSGALRLKLDGEYARGGVFGAMPDTLFQTDALISIDTTDQPGIAFVDNNRIALGVNYTNLSFGNLLQHGSFGISGRYSKAFHSDISNGDTVVTFSGWVPALPTLTLFSSEAGFIAPPLSINLSYGLRSSHVLDKSYHGKVFEGSALYHLFLFDKFELDLGGTWTVNDLSDRPPNVPRTQRLYKATISYLENPANGFRVMTSIEDGSAGTVLTRVRQYFIGVGLSRIHSGK